MNTSWIGRYWGTILTVLVSSALLTPKVKDWIISGTAYDWHDLLTAFLLAVLLMFLTNLGSIYNQKSAHEAKETAEEMYSSVRDGLQPVIRKTLNEKIRREASFIRKSCNCEDLQFYVFLFLDGLWKVVASSQPDSSQTWNLLLEDDEGVVGFTAGNQAEFLTVLQEAGKGIVYDKHEDKWGDPRELSKGNRARIDTNVSFIFSTPILGQTAGASLTKEFLGVMTVDSYTESGDRMMKDDTLRQRLLDLSGELAPHMGVLAEMVRIEQEYNT